MPPALAGMNWIAGGAAAAILLPLLAIGVGMPFWIAGIISAAAGGGLLVLLSPRNVWNVLTAGAPKLDEWAAFFAAGAGKRAAAEAADE